MRDHTATSYCSFDESIELFIPTNCELQMSGRNTLHLKILACIAGQLQHFCSKVFQDSGRVHSCCSTNSSIRCNSWLQKAVDSTYWKLQEGCWRMRNKTSRTSKAYQQILHLRSWFWKQFKNQGHLQQFLMSCLIKEIGYPNIYTAMKATQEFYHWYQCEWKASIHVYHTWILFINTF